MIGKEGGQERGEDQERKMKGCRCDIKSIDGKKTVEGKRMYFVKRYSGKERVWEPAVELEKSYKSLVLVLRFHKDFEFFRGGNMRSTYDKSIDNVFDQLVKEGRMEITRTGYDDWGYRSI